MSDPQSSRKASLRAQLAQAAQGGRINSVLGGGLGISDNTDALMRNMVDGFTEVAEALSTEVVKVSVLTMPSNEQTPDSRLAYPALLVVAEIDDSAVVIPYLVIPARMGDFEAVTIRFSQETMTLPRHPSEAYDQRARADFHAKAVTATRKQPANVHLTENKCVHNVDAFLTGEAESIVRAAQQLINSPLRLATATLLISHTGLMDDVTITGGLNANGTPAHLSINYKQSDTLRVDEDGLPLGSSMVSTVRVESPQGDNGNSLNRAQGSYAVGDIGIRASIVHASGQGAFNPAFAQQGQVRPPMFTPQLILEDLRVVGDPTPANIALMVASTVPLINPEVVRRMYDPKDIGFLNTRAMISGDAKPFADKDVRSALHQLWAAFFTNTVVVSMQVRLGSMSAMYAEQFLKSAQVDPVNVTPTQQTLSRLFGLPIAQCPKSAILPGTELVPIGTYKGDDGAQHPLSDIDLLWLIRHSHARPQFIDMWAMSQDGSRDSATSLALKMSVLKAVTNNTMKVVDRGLVFTFHPMYLAALSAGMTASNVGVMTNISSITGMETQRWAPYMTAATAVDFANFSAFQGNMVPGGNMGYYAPYGNGYPHQ